MFLDYNNSRIYTFGASLSCGVAALYGRLDFLCLNTSDNLIRSRGLERGYSFSKPTTVTPYCHQIHN